MLSSIADHLPQPGQAAAKSQVYVCVFKSNTEGKVD